MVDNTIIRYFVFGTLICSGQFFSTGNFFLLLHCFFYVPLCSIMSLMLVIFHHAYDDPLYALYQLFIFSHNQMVSGRSLEYSKSSDHLVYLISNLARLVHTIYIGMFKFVCIAFITDYNSRDNAIL